MDLRDSVEYAVKNLRMRQLRSWLTITGIVIGVIAMVVITSVTEGVSQYVEGLLSSFGPDFMLVIPVNIDSGGLATAGGMGIGQSPYGKLYQRDVDSVASVPGVKEVARTVYGRTTVRFKDKELDTLVVGIDPNAIDMFGDYFRIDQGRAYTDSERRVVVLGNDAANVVFGKDKVSVGNTMEIGGNDYRVVGILAPINHPFAAQDNAMIAVPFDEGKDLFRSQLAKNEVTYIYVKLDEGYDPADVKSAIEYKLASNHRVTLDDKDFSVITSDFIKETVGSILGLLSQLLLAITAVATLVGGIGISNTMFMAVLERVREVGILKSIGATGRDITLIFLTESALIGLTGGAIGFAAAAAILLVAGQFGVPYVIRPEWVASVFVFSVGVGIVAGYIPARQAAKMDPVRALGYV